MLTALRTPPGDGQVLLLPDSSGLTRLIADSRLAFSRSDSSGLARLIADSRLASSRMSFDVAGLPAAELRRQAREELASLADVAADRFWAVTGHQAEMHHAGVWFKDAVIAALAQTTGGEAIHLVADLDVVRRLVVPLPARAEAGPLHVRQTVLAESYGEVCAARVEAPALKAIQELTTAVAAMPCGRGLFDAWLAGAQQARGGTLAQWLSGGRQGLNTALGLAVHQAFFSGMVCGKAYAHFAADLLLQAERMCDLHNRALAAFRQRHGIRRRGQPVAALARSAEQCEAALWVWPPDKPRQRLLVSRAGPAIQLHTPNGPIGRIPADPAGAAEAVFAMANEGLWLAPRALTLTMFARCFLADLFVHGIGGAVYDCLGDELTEQYYGWRPPPFVTATATLRLDLPRRQRTDEELSAARWHAHHALHNPALYTDRPLGQAEQALLDCREEVLREMAVTQRRSADRARLYAKLIECLAELRERLSAAILSTRQRVGEIDAELADNAVADGREYPAAVMPAAKLRALISQAQTWAAGTRPEGLA